MLEKSVKVIRRKKDSSAEAGYVQTPQIVEAKTMLKFENRKIYKTRAERIAQDFEFYQRWAFKDAARHYPDEPWMRTVDKYFPQAFCGPLLIDEPDTAEAEQRCERKRIVLESIGYKYLIIKSGMTDPDCFMELETCGQRQQQQSQI